MWINRIEWAGSGKSSRLTGFSKFHKMGILTAIVLPNFLSLKFSKVLDRNNNFDLEEKYGWNRNQSSPSNIFPLWCRVPACPLPCSPPLVNWKSWVTTVLLMVSSKVQISQPFIKIFIRSIQQPEIPCQISLPAATRGWFRAHQVCKCSQASCP